jgi:hypothetical protein
LEVSPRVLNSAGSITLTLPAGSPLSTNRFRVALFEAGRPTRLAEVQRNFALVNGRQQTTFNIEAPPGRYELRLVSNDKARTPIPLYEPASLVVTGIDREPGWWLFNGSPFVIVEAPRLEASPLSGPPLLVPPTGVPRTNAVQPTAPLFIRGLQRDPARKSKDVAANIYVTSAGPQSWKILPLTTANDNVFAADFDFAALRVGLPLRISEVQVRGERNLVGVTLALDPQAISATGANGVRKNLAQLRQTLEAVAPGAALILTVRVSANTDAVKALSQVAPSCDAILLDFDAVASIGERRSLNNRMLWTLKAARRIAEEQPGYDLPIFVQFNNGDQSLLTPFEILDFLQAGATGFISGPGTTAGTSADHPENTAFQTLLERNASLFVGAVTLEDIGVLPQTEDPSPRNGSASGLYQQFRHANRIPLLARLDNDAKTGPESFVMRLGDRISADTIRQIHAAAEDGARIYLEGAPFHDENGKYAGWRMTSLVGGEAKVMSVDNDGAKSKMVDMILQDGWMFGTARGTRVPIIQRVTVTLGKGTMTAQTKTEKGKYIPTSPRAAAVLEDASPAVIINPVGKGEVIWAPHSVNGLAGLALLVGGSFPTIDGKLQMSTNAVLVPANPAPIRAVAGGPTEIENYLTAIAAYLQPGLVQVRSIDRKTRHARHTRVALRRSPRGTLLLSVFNDSDTEIEIGAGIDGVAGVALDLATETELPLNVRGFFSEATLKIAPHGWKLVAFAENRRKLDEERNAPRVKARIR